MADLKPKILAEDVDKFKAIADALAQLPTTITEQIEIAKNGGVGIECTIRYKYSQDSQTVYLPNYTQKINDFGDYIGIYCGAFFFKLEGELYKKKVNYIFIDVSKK